MEPNKKELTIIEDREKRQKTIEKAVRSILVAVGDDPNRDGLIETPKRVAKAWEDDLCSLTRVPPDIKTFEPDKDLDKNQMIVLRDAPINSYCEHHLYPFRGTYYVGYVPSQAKEGRIIGFSKLIRIAQHFAKRPQIQEKLTGQIANYLYKLLDPMGIMVVIKAEHQCITVRGAKAPGALAVTSAIRGKFDKNEFFILAGLNN